MFKIVSVYKTNRGSLPIEEYSANTSVFKLYNWIGEKDGINRDEMMFIELEKGILNKNVKVYEAAVYFTKKELKNKNIEIIDKNLKNTEESFKFINGIGITVCSNNNFEFTVITALEKAESDGILINEID